MGESWHWPVGICGTLCCIGLLLAAILIPISLKKIDHYQIGIRYDKITKSIGDTILEEGRHAVGPSGSIIRYTRTQLSINSVDSDSLFCLSSDGVEVEMAVQVQYQIRKEDLFDILEDFGEQPALEVYVRAIARDILRNVCSNFTAELFYFQRDAVQIQMLKALQDEFPVANTYCDVQIVNLIEVLLPASINTAIENTQLAVQDSEKALNERGQVLIEATADLQKMEVAERIAYVDAAVEVETTFTDATQQVAQLLTYWRERGNGLQTMRHELQMTPEEFVYDYIASTILESVDQPIVNVPIWDDSWDRNNPVGPSPPGKVATPSPPPPTPPPPSPSPSPPTSPPPPTAPSGN